LTDLSPGTFVLFHPGGVLHAVGCRSGVVVGAGEHLEELRAALATLEDDSSWELKDHARAVLASLVRGMVSTARRTSAERAVGEVIPLVRVTPCRAFPDGVLLPFSAADVGETAPWS
jgi:hypothetical protein